MRRTLIALFLYAVPAAAQSSLAPQALAPLPTEAIRLAALDGQVMQLRVEQAQLQVTQQQLATLPHKLQSGFITSDPADSLYHAARTALTKSQYKQAAELFAQVRTKYPKSAYVADTYYYQAFALYRTGNNADLRQATTLLQAQREKYPTASTAGDTRALMARIDGQLASGGDAGAAERTATTAYGAMAPVAPAAPIASGPGVPPMPPAGMNVAHTPRTPRTPREPNVRAPRDHNEDDACSDDDDDVQVAALNGLMQMDAARALPILQKVLARRDSGSVCLRRKAVFLVAQQESANSESILLNVARTDPDPEVRGQAVFWLSQVNSPTAVAALDSILRSSKDPELQEKALFALSQQESPKAGEALRDYASNDQAPEELREKAIFWLGQKGDAASIAFLKTLYARVSSAQLKERILFAVSQSSDTSGRAWLLEVAQNPKEPIDVRKQALFWAEQNGASVASLSKLYGQLQEQELKEQLIFVLSQSNDPAAVTKLIDIARTDPDRELRKKAIFWLGQSNDPRAAPALEAILTGAK